jgi:pimeloyl-ACP methyl ester carboxylesterase
MALDQRGHGESARTERYSFEAMRDDAAGFLDALGIERVTLIGHSMGGSVAFLFAEAWPERVERLVIEDTPPPWPSGLPEPPAEEPHPSPFECDWQAVVGIVRQLNHPDPAWWDRLGDITAPALIIGGGSTSHVPQERLAAAAARMPDSRLITIEGAGHNVHLTRADAFLDAVTAFLTPAPVE